ncbi:hypothetical protein [Micropruina sp.]|uniref:hypothetical protein n=1 Tax=Micropruina sp. TaxID=2737536 RepID=UPI0039E39F02
MATRSRRARNQPDPPHIVEGVRLSMFIKKHLPEAPIEVWATYYRHSPDYNPGDVRYCTLCGEVWPCRPQREVASRWSDDPEFRPEWSV